MTGKIINMIRFNDEVGPKCSLEETLGSDEKLKALNLGLRLRPPIWGDGRPCFGGAPNRGPRFGDFLECSSPRIPSICAP